MEDQVKVYWSKDIAAQLEISTSTLRKWSLALEREGYTVIRDEHDRRAYIPSDLDAFKQMKTLINNGMSVEDASKAVAMRYLSDLEETRTLAVRPKSHDDGRSSPAYLELLQEQKDLKQSMESFMAAMSKQHDVLHQELADQRTYIEDVLKKRDEQLLNALKQNLSKKPWWSIFKKNRI